MRCLSSPTPSLSRHHRTASRHQCRQLHLARYRQFSVLMRRRSSRLCSGFRTKRNLAVGGAVGRTEQGVSGSGARGGMTRRSVSTVAGTATDTLCFPIFALPSPLPLCVSSPIRCNTVDNGDPDTLRLRPLLLPAIFKPQPGRPHITGNSTHLLPPQSPPSPSIQAPWSTIIATATRTGRCFPLLRFDSRSLVDGSSPTRPFARLFSLRVWTLWSSLQRLAFSVCVLRTDAALHHTRSCNDAKLAPASESPSKPRLSNL
ncbi:hypothetical protein K438DRAFT_441200 [Mycena galopus ATCC 62051]|nr:hypothetical protein K438DRAFT_441200 [Mycena galopus ATCC 62051]